MSAISPHGISADIFLSLQAMHFDFLLFLHKQNQKKS